MTSPLIGVDIDGVLANQIHGVLPRIEARHGVKLSYEDVIHWRLPIGSTDIAAEIDDALTDATYIDEMPIHDGAREMLSELHGRYRVALITARPPHALAATRGWLERHGLEHDELIAAKSERKSLHGATILIDDYLGNVSEFLQAPGGRSAIVVDQPWNRVREELATHIEAGRLAVADDLRAVPPFVTELLARP